MLKRSSFIFPLIILVTAVAANAQIIDRTRADGSKKSAAEVKAEESRNNQERAAHDRQVNADNMKKAGAGVGRETIEKPVRDNSTTVTGQRIDDGLFKGIYTGRMDNRKIKGQGKLVCDDGRIYDGVWTNASDGNGSIVFANGDKYYGAWEKGLMNGPGSYKSATLSGYGEWFHGNELKVYWSPVYTGPAPDNKPLAELKFIEGLSPYKVDGKYGYVDRTGKLVVPPIYVYGSPFQDGLAKVFCAGKPERVGFLNPKGELVIPCMYDWSRSFSDGLAPVRETGGKVFYIDKMNKQVLPAIYYDANEFTQGLAKVQLEANKWGLIDKTGKVIIPLEYNLLEYRPFPGNLFMLKRDYGAKWEIINVKGEAILPPTYDELHYWGNGEPVSKLITVQKDKLWGAIDNERRVVIPFQFSTEQFIIDGLEYVDSAGVKQVYKTPVVPLPVKQPAMPVKTIKPAIKQQ